MLWAGGLAAVVAGFVLLFEDPGTPTRTEIVNRAAGGSFIVCGLNVWQRRPDSRTGLWMTATGFLYLGPQLLEGLPLSHGFERRPPTPPTVSRRTMRSSTPARDPRPPRSCIRRKQRSRSRIEVRSSGAAT